MDVNHTASIAKDQDGRLVRMNAGLVWLICVAGFTLLCCCLTYLRERCLLWCNGDSDSEPETVTATAQSRPNTAQSRGELYAQREAGQHHRHHFIATTGGGNAAERRQNEAERSLGLHLEPARVTPGGGTTGGYRCVSSK